MSKLKIRIILSIVISLGVIFAVYTTVLGAPFERTQSHSASDTLTNYGGLIVTEREAYYSELEAYNNPTKGNGGHGCESEYNGPID